jgi:hypothetical protein
MNDTPDFFRDIAGTLAVSTNLLPLKALGEKEADVIADHGPTQKTLHDFSTNLSGGAESYRAASMDERIGNKLPATVRASHPVNASTMDSGSSAPPAQKPLLPVSVLIEPGLTPCSSRQETPARNGEARESTNGGRQDGLPVESGDSLGGQRSFNEAANGHSVGRGNENQGQALISPSKQQLVRTREAMRDGKWRSLSEISSITGDPEASVSARLRQLRTPKGGLWTVRRKRIGSLFFYSLGGKGI